MGRADLQEPEAGVPLGLSGQCRHEVVYALGVLNGAGQGTAACPRHAPPTGGVNCPSAGSTLHRRMALDTEARSLRARSANPRRLRASRRRPLRCTRETRPSRPRREVSLDTPEGESSKRPPRSSAVIQGHSESRSSSRLSAGLSAAGSRWPGNVIGFLGDGEVTRRGIPWSAAAQWAAARPVSCGPGPRSGTGRRAWP